MTGAPVDGQARRAAFVTYVTKTVRKVLRERWPSVDLVVDVRPSASWTRLDIHWTDGPTRLMVTQLVEATVAAIDDESDSATIEIATRRRLSEEGVAAALIMVTDNPPAEWLLPNGLVSWVRFSIPASQHLMDEFTLPERPVSAHHLAALVANRVDLSFALARQRR